MSNLKIKIAEAKKSLTEVSFNASDKYEVITDLYKLTDTWIVDSIHKLDDELKRSHAKNAPCFSPVALTDKSGADNYNAKVQKEFKDIITHVNSNTPYFKVFAKGEVYTGDKLEATLKDEWLNASPGINDIVSKYFKKVND